MDEVKKILQLNDVEEKELREGQAIYEMTQSAGWKVIEEKLQDMAFHSWVDPREVENEKDYLWRELNGFHAANNARELLEWVQKCISSAEYLDKKKKGEITIRTMGIK